MIDGMCRGCSYERSSGGLIAMIWHQVTNHDCRCHNHPHCKTCILAREIEQFLQEEKPS